MFSDIFSGLSSLYGGIQARNLDRAQFDRQMQFADEQSRTQYQRAVEDMKAAGLNPMLTVAKGGNAAMSAPGWSGASNVQGQAAASALNARLIAAQTASANAAARKTNAEAGITEEVGLDQAMATLSQTLTSTGLTASQIDKTLTDIKLVAQQILTEKNKTDQIASLIRYVDQQTETEIFKTMTEEQRVKWLTAATTTLANQAKLQDFDIEAARKSDNFGRIFREYEGAGRLGKEYVDSILGNFFDWKKFKFWENFKAEKGAKK